MKMKSKYASILNNLNAMQQSHAYALRKHILTEAEQVIVTLEKELQAAEAKIANLRKLGNTVIENLGGQNHTNGCDDFYQVDHAVIAPFGEALDECYESSAKFLAGVRAEALEEVQMMFIKWYVSERELRLVCDSVAKRDELTRLMIGASELRGGAK
jgi:hypothetical protein